LFVDFFLTPSSTNDYIDVDGDGRFGFSPVFPFVDNLGPLWTAGGNLSTWWLFQYRSVGSVNGFNEFVENQTCNAIPLQIPTEAGVFNQFRYANLGVAQWAGPFDNSSATPLQPCEIEFSFLDVPSKWAVQVPGTPTWNAQPTGAGYGLNPIPSSTGFISNLQTLGRQCGTCANSGDSCTKQDQCAPGHCSVSVGLSCRADSACPAGACSVTPNACREDTDCPAGQCSVTAQSCRGNADCPGGETCTNPAPETCSNPPAQTCVSIEACNLAGPVASLNNNTISPDEDTIFDYRAAWVPIAPISNRGTGVENVRYSELQYLFTTGRFPNGENFTAATRDVGSGTRNGEMNSLGIDTSWGRGDNIGKEALLGTDSQLGPNTQPTNLGGSGVMENGVQSRRLAIGYTGLGGASRAIADAIGGLYEILNVCKDVDENGNPTACDCNPKACAGSPTKVCSISTSIDCTVGGVCPGGESCVFITPANPNNGYVRPTLTSVLDNCDECCGFQLGGNGSFVTRGDPFGGAFMPDNDAVTDYINNIAASAAAFSGVQGAICAEPQYCSLTNQQCFVDADCPGGETCTRLKPCAVNADCPVGVCEDELTRCQVDANCAGIGGGTCTRKTCVQQVNMPGEFLARTFFIPEGDDCNQSTTNGMQFDPTVGLNQALQNYVRANGNFGGVGQTPAFGSVNPTDGGRRPIRNNLISGTYSEGSTGAAFTYFNPPSFVTNFTGNRLATRNKIQGDFNEDGRRSIADADDLVDAYHAPRKWQRTDPQAMGTATGAALGNQLSDNAIPELLGDFNGDGNLTKEDLRYFADGLATANLCYNGPNDGDPCANDAGCPKGRCGRLDRKAGAIAIDTRMAAWGRCNNDLTIPCLVNQDCVDRGVGGTCDQGLARGLPNTYIPWADPALQLLVPSPLGVDPTFIAPKEVNDVSAPFLKTGATYGLGDFRGDVAGGSPIAGAYPAGWDGFVDEKDINYCCRSVRAGSWSSLDSAVYMDLSCDMDGDLEVDLDDLSELAGGILKTGLADADLDGDVDVDDSNIALDSLDDPCNDDASCGWEDGDFNCDGLVTADDLVFLPPAPLAANTFGTCTGNNANCAVGGPACAQGTCDPCNQVRSMSFQIPATSAGTDTAIRVRLTSLYDVVAPLPTSGIDPGPALAPFEGQYRYLNTIPGTLSRCCNPNSNPTACAPSPTSCNSDADCTVGLNTKCMKNLCPDSPAFSTFFRCARLGCTPEYRDWGSDFSGLVTYASGDSVVSDSTYHVAHLAASCAGNEAACAAASPELQVLTERWGNVDCTQVEPPTAGDIGFVVSKVKDAAGAFIKPRTQLREAIPNPLALVAAQDIARIVDAVKGRHYPDAFTIGACP
jgi:hypothetical protein